MTSQYDMGRASKYRGDRVNPQSYARNLDHEMKVMYEVVETQPRGLTSGQDLGNCASTCSSAAYIEPYTRQLTKLAYSQLHNKSYRRQKAIDVDEMKRKIDPLKVSDFAAGSGWTFGPSSISPLLPLRSYVPSVLKNSTTAPPPADDTTTDNSTAPLPPAAPPADDVIMDNLGNASAPDGSGAPGMPTTTDQSSEPSSDSSSAAQDSTDTSTVSSTSS
jgi:hypothetical protein